MECPRCGRAAEPDHNFCNGCGYRMRVRTADGAVEATPQVGAGPVDDMVDVVADDGDTGEVVLVEGLAGDTGVDFLDPDVTGELPAVDFGAADDRATGVVAAGDDDVTSPRGLDAPTDIVAIDDTDGPVTADVAVTAHVTAATPVHTQMAPRSTAVLPTTSPVPPATQVVPQTGYGRPIGGQRFHLTATSGLGLAVTAAIVAVLFAPLLSVRSTVTVLLDNAAVPDGFRFGSWTLGNLGSNLPVAALICATGAAVGAVATGYRKAWGAGLIAGSSLSFVGIVALAVGLLQFPIDAAYAFARIPTEVPIGLSITREPGYWLMLTSAGLAVVAAFSSIRECLDDTRRNLNPWFAAFGALSVLLLVAGAMIPLNGAMVSDNWFVVLGPGEAPQALVAGRLVQLGLLALTGVTGFLLVRSYGLGLAVGGTLPSLWLGLSVLLGGDNPVGPGWRNPGATKMDVHPVTIIEMAVVLALLVLASLSAYGQRASDSRGRRS